jgi:hypothetical protein
MAGKLKKFPSTTTRRKGDWRLTNDATDKVVERFEFKVDATKAGVLSQAIGSDRGTVRIKAQDNKYQEERTFPRTADPESSQG